jgi:hypothetical protein
MARIAGGWRAKFETSPAKLGCPYRAVSFSGSPRITLDAPINSTGEPGSVSSGSRDPRTPRVDTARGNGARRQLLDSGVLADGRGCRARSHPPLLARSGYGPSHG